MTEKLVTRPKILPRLLPHSRNNYCTSSTQTQQQEQPTPAAFPTPRVPTVCVFFSSCCDSHFAKERESIRWENGRGELFVGAVAVNQGNRRAPQVELV